MTDPTDTQDEPASRSSLLNGEGGPTLRSLSRRRALAAIAAAGNVSLAGCLSFDATGLSIGPSIRTSGLAHSPVFKAVEAAETFSVGGNQLTVSVYLKPAAHDRFGIKELEVLAAGDRPFSAADADTPPGPFQTGMNVPLEVPVDQPATITALNENKTTVESIRVWNDATTILAGLGAKSKSHQTRINHLTMPAKILTNGFETRQTQFSTDAWMTGKIKNTAKDGELIYLLAEAVFRDDAGQVIDRSAESIEGLSAGEVWEAVVPYYGDATNATRGTLTVSESIAGRSPIPPTNVTVVEESLEQPDEAELEPPKVVGEVRNTGTTQLPFLEADVKFYAENGNVLGSAASTVTGLNAGKTWSFEVPFDAHSTERAARVAEYDLSLVS